MTAALLPGKPPKPSDESGFVALDWRLWAWVVGAAVAGLALLSVMPGCGHTFTGEAYRVDVPDRRTAVIYVDGERICRAKAEAGRVTLSEDGLRSACEQAPDVCRDAVDRGEDR